MKIIFSCIIIIFSCNLYAQEIVIKNDKVKRVLRFDGKVWRTTMFASIDNKSLLKVNSDEFHILGMDDSILTVGDFEADRSPVLITKKDTSILTVKYKRNQYTYSDNAPVNVIIQYKAVKGEYVIRKNITLLFGKQATVDRLEVERFTTDAKATGGGRGEPVFLSNQWFTGLEYPAGYSRHTDGNTPAAYSRHYDSVGNYSFINLEGRDIESHAKAGMVRLMHFPGYALAGAKGIYTIKSKTAVTGTGKPGENAAVAFINYLTTVWKAPRSFLHYNNWFEPKAKDLKGNALLDIYTSFKKAITPYGIKMNAMVADAGWQNHQSIWQPSPKYFPNGIADMKVLSDKLKAQGTALGLWLSIGGTDAGVDWGIQHGYLEAKPNKYFSQYFRYYSLSHPKYKNEMLKQVPALAKGAGLVYYKHDFNQLSDLNDNAGHPATDRHGHEANLDAMLDILTATRKAQPAIYQNITNWIWFSPWWLMYGDALWMLAGDDGMNGNWPEISSRAMATTDRDTYIWRMWGDSADHPLVPVSRLMTHGIIRSSTGNMESPDDTMQDWLEHVLMHYGRGTLLKEWYISPGIMSPDHWKALCTIHNWVKAHQSCFNNTVFAGGRPDEGNPYGYIGWHNNKAVLVARNPSAVNKKLIIPFDESVGYNGKGGLSFYAKVVFPYSDVYPKTFVSGKTIEIELPGYATMAFEIAQGALHSNIVLPAPLTSINKTDSTVALELPADCSSRCDLLVIGYDAIPAITVNGKVFTPARSSHAAINKFASYAIAGMPSDKAKPWKMVSFDLKKMAGKKISISFPVDTPASTELHLLMERTVHVPDTPTEKNIPWTITNNARRYTVQLK
ncbi:MAG: hypothetical protein QM802_24535 [Agriterribacter sp.]